MPDAHHNIPYRGVKRPHEVWIIDKKITIKAQGTELDNFKVDNIIDYRLQETNDFEIEIEKDSTDINLPATTTNFDGNHKYDDVIDNLDYLMIHRGDFDKFNYSYLYWTPIFNFINTLEKGYYKEFIIKNHGFKDESYFHHKTSSGENEINKNVLKIKAFNKTLIAGNNYLQLLHGESEIWKYDTTNTNDYYLIKYLFGTLSYLNVKFSFLRYDPELKNDIYLYFKNNIPSINNSDYKNVFNEIYEILGNFFASLFYATFDMDEKTHTEIDFKGVDNYKKDHFIQIGFFYRSLITFYPKKYLINVTGNSELLLRSYFFTFDKKSTKRIIMPLKTIIAFIKLILMFLNLMTINWLNCQPVTLLIILIILTPTLIFATALIFLP